jgi:hypothetical protein
VLADDDEAANNQDLSLDMTPLTFWQSIKPWSGVTPGGWGMAVRTFYHMAACLTAPGMLWAVCWTGMSLAILIGLSLTFGDLLVAPPISWPPMNSGVRFMFISC